MYSLAEKPLQRHITHRAQVYQNPLSHTYGERKIIRFNYRVIVEQPLMLPVSFFTFRLHCALCAQFLFYYERLLIHSSQFCSECRRQSNMEKKKTQSNSIASEFNKYTYCSLQNWSKKEILRQEFLMQNEFGRLQDVITIRCYEEIITETLCWDQNVNLA